MGTQRRHLVQSGGVRKGSLEEAAGRQALEEEEVSCSRPGRAEVLQGTAPMS